MILAKLFHRPEEPALVFYDRAIAERQAAYAALLALTRRALFLRAQREGEVRERRAAIARVHDGARSAARAGDDDRARLFLEEKRQLLRAVADDEDDLGVARADALEAERRLVALGAEIDALRRKRRRALAETLAQAVEETAARPLAPRLQAALRRADETTRDRRARLESLRSLDTDEDPGVMLELRALRAG